jgi:methyl-accepting chemotaxis protein
MRTRIALLVGAATLLSSSLNVLGFWWFRPDLGAREVVRGFAAGATITLVAALLAFLAARRLTAPLLRLRDAAVAIADGDLTRRVDLAATPEIADLAASFSAMTEGLQATIAELRGAAMTLDARSSDILGSVTRQAAMSSQQAAAINETSTTAAEIAQTSKQATQHADSVIEMTKRSDELSREGLHTVDEAVKASASLGEQVNRIAASMSGLSERTLQIGEIIASVKDLAEQSNLLALNASIEASKAGEHGRGFAVVAMEMRNLAEGSRQAAVQIRSILGEIQRGAREAAAATDEGAKRAAAAMELARSAGEAIEGLATVIRDSAGAARQIASNTRQQTVGVDQMVTAIGELSSAINESAEGTRVIEQGTTALSEISKQLASAVQRYRV